MEWSHLSKVDLAEIGHMLKREPREGSLLELEARLAIATMLTTGRKLADIRRMTIVGGKSDLDGPGGSPEGLIWTEKKIEWRFIAGTAEMALARAAKKERKGSARSDQKFEYIEVPVDDLVKECILAFKGKFALTPCLRTSPSRIFKVRRAQIIERISTLLATRRESHAGIPRASSRTYQSLERFLTRAITHEYGGDLIGAMRLTGRDEKLGRTANFYGRLFFKNAVRQARRATKLLKAANSEDDEKEPDWTTKQIVGSDKSPLWTEVRQLAYRCDKFLRQSQANVFDRHRAMTYQTLALVSFATGHRGMAEQLPASSAIDSLTGFCSIHDKMTEDADRSRMIWVADVAREQIGLYEEHLADLSDVLNRNDYDDITGQIDAGRLPLFDIVDGRACHLRYRALWANLSADLQLPRPLLPNAGRHWLRSMLSGHCRSDTIQAFFGHWLLGNEPWSFGSCLDPLHYRSELKAKIPRLLRDAGWRALSAKGVDA